MTVWSEERLDGLRVLRGRAGAGVASSNARGAGALEVAILPEVGAKMISLRAPSGREWLWQTRRRPFRVPEYGGAFEAYDISGFDECFPGIGEGPYPTGPWEGVTVPDHGELWTLPWRAEIDGDTLTLSVNGVRFPYRLEKRVSLEAPDAAPAQWAGNRDGSSSGSGNGGRVTAAVRLEYRLTNLSPFPLRYLWSAHPLFDVRPGTRVLLPHGVRVRTDWSKDGRLGPLGTEHAWPVARVTTPGGGAGSDGDTDGGTAPLDVLPDATAGSADKLYTMRLPTTPDAGWCALYDPGAGSSGTSGTGDSQSAGGGEFVAFRFDPARVPYIGVWLNLGGWPLSGEPCFNVALEPCTGYPDRLDLAVQRDEAATLPGSGVVEWTLRLEVGTGPPAPGGAPTSGA